MAVHKFLTMRIQNFDLQKVITKSFIIKPPMSNLSVSQFLQFNEA